MSQQYIRTNNTDEDKKPEEPNKVDQPKAE